MAASVLAIDADADTLTGRGDELLADGHDVLVAASDAAARQRLPQAGAVVLGSLGSESASLCLLRDLRAGRIARTSTALPVLTIGADAEHQVIRHYDAGADIALPTNASPTLVAAGLRSLTARRERTFQPNILSAGDIELDLNARSVKIAGEAIQLSRAPWEILRTLIETAESVVSKQDLQRAVTGSPVAIGRSETAQIARVRKALAAGGSSTQIVNHPGIGYRLTDPQRAARSPTPSRKPRGR